MKTEKRLQWLSTLNADDEVAYTGGGVFRSWTITKVRKVTPSGRLNLNDGTTINADGSIRGNKHFYIHPVTDEIRVSIWRNRAINKLRNNLKIEKLSNDDLKVLLKMLDA